MNFRKSVEKLARALYWVAGASIIAMMLITCADVVLRFLRRPIPGTYELVCFFGALAVSFAMAHTSLLKGHVAVSVVVELFSIKIQGYIESVTNMLGLILFSMIAWRSILYANDLRATGEVSMTLQMPFYPFVYGIGFSAAGVCLVLLAYLIENVTSIFDK